MSLLLSLILTTSPLQGSVYLKENTVAVSGQYDEIRQIVASNSNHNPNVLEGYDRFAANLASLAGNEISNEEISRICDAISFSAQKHASQTRKDPEHTPYIIHPIGVADSILTIGKVYDPDIIIAALLHDTVEDTDTSFEEIRDAFGPVVEGYVREVTDDKALPKEVRKQLQIDDASHKSDGAAIVKLADKLYNVEGLHEEPPADWPKERVDEYFAWAKRVVDNLPPANEALKEAVDQTIARRAI
jgi:guanosine-3',5'-bis(diphosphate) 3'-pyrophosphohydrolase